MGSRGLNRAALIGRQHSRAIAFYKAHLYRQRPTKPQFYRALEHISTLTDIVSALMGQLADVSDVANFREPTR